MPRVGPQRAPRPGGRQAGVQGATEVPVYVVDEDMSPALLLKKASNLGLGGWWLGGTHMKPNKGFIGAVQQKVPKDAQLIVSCQKGLRRAPGPAAARRPARGRAAGQAPPLDAMGMSSAWRRRRQQAQSEGRSGPLRGAHCAAGLH
jgi:hypothetical protein